ncbi:hypothetical protein PINS_up019382 [Pythium insidiosum]|nr:hypothetical protein PINS_up019382 [Pythium insidiosum]
MQFLKQLTDPALKRLYKFVLKRLIGRFLADDEIDLDQLDVHLRSGRLELCDLMLSAEMLNAEVCEPHGLPFRVKKGYLGSVRVTISYTNIMSESCLVEIDDIEIVLEPVDVSDAHASTDRGSSSRSTVADTARASSLPTADASQSRASNKDAHIDEISQEGLDFVASWIEQVTSKIKVTLSNICLRVETGDSDPAKNVALLLKLEWAQFTDESASEVASVYGRVGGDTNSMGSSQSMYQSMASSSLFGVSQKGVKFRGISMELSLPGDDVIDTEPVLRPFLASDSSRPCYVQTKLSHYEALDAPSVDADLFLHSFQVVLQPQHFPRFGALIDAFSRETPRAHFEQDRAYFTSMQQSICETKPAWLNDDDNDQAAGEGNLKLSFREFQRIEQILQHYQRTHDELRNIRRQSSAHDADVAPFPMPRRLSAAESVESFGLSDLEDDENFFECETGAASVSLGGIDSMAQSMYASALFEPADEDNKASRRSSVIRSSSARAVRTRVKVHLLECDHLHFV